MGDKTETTPSGDPVLRHGEAAPFQRPETSATNVEAVTAHVERHIGRCDMVFHEIISDKIHLDLLWVPPSEALPGNVLVTSGMSDLPMTVPDEPDWQDLRHAELLIVLPPNWPLSGWRFRWDRYFWPLRWLKTMARFPHDYGTCLGPGHTLGNGEPPERLGKGTDLSGVLIMPPLTFEEGFLVLERPGRPPINFYAMIPIHTAELTYKLEQGLDALLDRFDEAGISEYIDPKRRSVV